LKIFINDLINFFINFFICFFIMINKVTLIGRLGNDPEVRRLEGGSVVSRFSLATSESYKDKDGNYQENTEWHNVIAWRDLAERAEKMLKKGTLVYVEGKITYRKYTGTDNIERSVTDIIANNFRILEKREGGANDRNFPTTEPAKYQQPSSSPAPELVEADGASVSADNGADLPF
jgi:single-strand DNA-binding protein